MKSIRVIVFDEDTQKMETYVACRGSDLTIERGQLSLRVEMNDAEEVFTTIDERAARLDIRLSLLPNEG